MHSYNIQMQWQIWKNKEFKKKNTNFNKWETHENDYIIGDSFKTNFLTYREPKKLHMFKAMSFQEWL